MAKRYLIEGQFEEVPFDATVDPGKPSVDIVSSEEFSTLNLGDADVKAALHDLVTAENTYLDVYPQCLIGSFAVPNKNDLLSDPLLLAFYLEKTRLVFIDEDGSYGEKLERLVKQKSAKQPSVARCLFEFMQMLVKDDLEFLSKIEDHMEDVEEQILDRGAKEANRKMLGFRRKLLRIDTYYQQLVDMSSTIAANENHLLSHEETRLFTLFSRQADRLLKRSQTLKEYSFQLRELYQTQIDIKQNDTIQWFTVITTIFVPLTLITSWYGMNFKFMPELEMPWSYFVIIGICAIIVIMELRFFKRKKWL